MTSIPKPGISQPTILYPSVSVLHPCSLGKLPDVCICAETISPPSLPPTSNPALTSNSESGNFKHKQTSLPQTTSGAVPKEAGARGPQLGTRASRPSPAPWGLWTPDLTTGCRWVVQIQMGSVFGLADGFECPLGLAQQWVQKTLPRSNAKLVNFLCAISTPIRYHHPF